MTPSSLRGWLDYDWGELPCLSSQAHVDYFKKGGAAGRCESAAAACRDADHRRRRRIIRTAV